MRDTITVLGFASVMLLGTAGCIIQDDELSADKFRQGIPSANEVKLQEPVAAQGTAQTNSFEPIMVLQDTPGGAKSYAQYYRFTREMFDGVNLGTAAILGSVWIIVHYPPTTLEEDEATWGPWTEALSPAEYRFRATETDTDTYDYALEARAKDSSDTWRPVWLGQGYGDEHPDHRSGWFELDFDAANEIDPTRLNADEESGKVRVTYDHRTFPTTIRATMTEESSSAWFDISVTTDRDGGGRVDIDAVDDIDDAKNTLNEDIAMRSRWLPTGAGRADVTIANGDLPAGTVVEASECWSTSFERVYWSDNIGIEAEQGEAGSCAFPDGQFK